MITSHKYIIGKKAYESRGIYKMNMRENHSRGGFKPRRQSNFGGPRQMHKTTCSACQKECEVPFKPIEGREVFCKDCYSSRKSSSDSYSPKSESKTEESYDSDDSDDDDEE